jgi:precorrin-6A synthase
VTTIDHGDEPSSGERQRRRLSVIGIGPGDPDLVTIEAASEMAGLDVVLHLGKSEASADLATVRTDMLDRFAHAPRVVVVPDPVRDPNLPYATAVAEWHAERAARIEKALLDEVGVDERAGILAWGDPALYDSVLRIIDAVNERGVVEIEHTVVAGISSIQLLAARHRIPLNRVGESFLVTTGRRLRDGLPDGIDDAVVVLDAECSFQTLVGQDVDIWWGAYLGTADEVLIAGPLDDVADSIVEIRSDLRDRKGWIFDTYLVRRHR